MRAVVALLALCLALKGQASTEDENLVKARLLLKETPLVDGHNDLAWIIRENTNGDLSQIDLEKTQVGDTNIQKLIEGQVAAQFWSVWIPPELGSKGYARLQLEQIDLVHRMIEDYPETFRLALTADEMVAAWRGGRIASLLGMEGGYGLENSLGALRAYYRLGVRYMTLAHWTTLDWVDSATDKARHDGLSEFGIEVVREMNRLGMLVDLAHVSEATMLDVLEHSAAPIIFSHSLARGLVDHPRNVSDRVLRRLAENGGIIMASFIPGYLSDKVRRWQKGFASKLPTGFYSTAQYDAVRNRYIAEHGGVFAQLGDVADHLDYLREVAGEDHIGIGSDFWGSADMPEGLEDPSRFPHLFAELLRRGWSESALRKLAGENFLRTFRAAEKVAQQLQQTRQPSTLQFPE